MTERYDIGYDRLHAFRGQVGQDFIVVGPSIQNFMGAYPLVWYNTDPSFCNVPSDVKPGIYWGLLRTSHPAYSRSQKRR